MPPAAAPFLAAGQHPPPNPASLAQALRGINDGTKELSLEGRMPPPMENSPYTKSISSTTPGSPRIPPLRQNSGTQTPRVRPHATTLNIPGMTKSTISPDGKIADRDVAAKLVIIMVGLPARGKSYITKKLKRYLSWQQHNTRIFNVGNRRRVAVDVRSPLKPAHENPMDAHAQVAQILLNGKEAKQESPTRKATSEPAEWNLDDSSAGSRVDQSANFFDPKNSQGSRIREQLAIDTLDELLDYLIDGGGAVGILDATNSTIERRQRLFDHIKAREPKLGILFIESVCQNPDILEANMRLKLSGPDYKDKDPVKSLEDFRARVKQYESAYVPLGDYEEDHGMQYIKMIDVGKKLTHFGLEGFLSGGIAHYLSSFNLAPRQIWITRHGQSVDNHLGKIGGNSELTERGHFYAHALYGFITQKRGEWLVEQKDKLAKFTFPPLPGDRSPPYPEMNRELDEKNTCVWTSMLKRSIQTAEYFEADDDYDTKAFEMLNELNAGKFEGLTYEEIARSHSDEYVKRQSDKLHYVYPGVGGEGYLQIINKLRDMVREIERIKDHVVVIGHRSVCRVLMAYFMDLTRDDIADLDVPLGMVYAIEPKPYGVEFHAYKYNEEKGWFEELPDYRPSKTVDQNA
ncbi:6-phosphofructo-2-kinase-domain-containing protein [Truncatella angustata]|uniref:6-phosphofructo-2-kinase-domain-containing protein n=1 Tax=Truncatella angustata TaxID=152316 RepID=A0A9P9A173_9PEZI|nr:6-phosphofructo-2-kinase-domain-containing protein [Truncatella angustata]KAH6656735.1 6-phosphofructo-2-kinase-domain-containing protein [Truncatella angustata]